MHLKATKKQQTLATAGLLATTLIWGWGFIFSKMALDEGISPITLQMIRSILASICSLAIFGRHITQKYKKGQWKTCFSIGSILFLAFVVQTMGLAKTTPGNNAFITTSYVVMVPFINWVAFKKRPPGVMFLACFVALAGLGVLTLDVQNGFSVNIGDLLTLLSALLFAIQIVATERVLHKIDPSVLVCGQMIFSSLWSVVAFFVTGAGMNGVFTMKGSTSILFLGIFSSFLCYQLQTVSQQYVSSIRAGILLSTEALFACLFSVIMGYDQITPRILIGGLLLVGAGVLPILRQGRRALRQ